MPPKRKNKGKAQAHQNHSKYVHCRHNLDGRLPDKAFVNMHSGMCPRCRDIMDWRRNFGKWVKLDQNKICGTCRKRTIDHPYAKICKACVKKSGKCAHCQKTPEKGEAQLGDFIPTHAERQKMESTEENELKLMSEREKRALLRAYERGEMDDSDDEDDERSNDHPPRSRARQGGAQADGESSGEEGEESGEEGDEEEGESEGECGGDEDFGHQFPTNALRPEIAALERGAKDCEETISPGEGQGGARGGYSPNEGVVCPPVERAGRRAAEFARAAVQANNDNDSDDSDEVLAG